ncbi:hypothetical protein F9L33_07645 [Amylibacter sp. SFDW26]|uniref:hypothetical protein n=1 Tax=Amylibacter sp. SFDW26 TaxID=2652722 RepID=UPI001261A12D|nr:hypothetical protein [Amylibacter sp. SFDW26]KAB7614505.1 hypothetical protein F9L33_07645 [Amylibacter sp. SFDW26]
MKFTCTALFAALISTAAFADSPVIVAVDAGKSGSTWRFDVTLKHADTGWDHYADGWGVYLKDGTELGYRVLAHPHVNEQPFTRSLGGVSIPAGTKSVIIKPRDSVHGVGADFEVNLR